MNLDEFLIQQEQQVAAYLATVEAVPNEPTKVRITPWEDGHCGCSRSLIVAKETIEQVDPTNDTHLCCGKTLRVVRVQFRKDATVLVADILSQASKPTVVDIPKRMPRAGMRGPVHQWRRGMDHDDPADARGGAGCGGRCDDWLWGCYSQCVGHGRRGDRLCIQSCDLFYDDCMSNCWSW